MIGSHSGPRLAWASFSCTALLCAAFAASLFFQGAQYAVLVAVFLLALGGALLAAWSGRVDGGGMSISDLWVTFLACALIAAVFVSPVLYASAGAALWLALFFCGYVVARKVPDTPLFMALGVIGVTAGAIVAGHHLLAGGSLGGPFLYRHMFSAVVVISAFLFAAGVSLHGDGSRRLRHAGLFTAALIAFLLLGLGGSRGMLLAGFAAAASVCVAMPRGHRAAPLWFMAGAFAGLLGANLFAQGLVVQQAATLADPLGAGAPRFTLWASVLPLIAERPLLGHGPGLLFAVWPPFRVPDDLSAGYYAHNSFLDIAVTAGIPAALLVAAIIASSIHAAMRAMRDHTTQAAWLLGALVVFTVHALVDFSLMVPTIWLLLGVCAGTLAAAGPPLRVPAVVPGRRWAATGAVAVSALLVAYAATSIVGYAAHQQAGALLERGEPMRALVQADKAVRWWPASDEGRLRRAYIILSVALEADSAADNPAARDALASAHADVERALALNPLRPATYQVGARLHLAGAHLGFEADGLTAAESLLTAALAVDPRDLETRWLLARVLDATGRRPEALEVLQGGLRYRRARGEVPAHYIDRMQALTEPTAYSMDGISRGRR